MYFSQNCPIFISLMVPSAGLNNICQVQSKLYRKETRNRQSPYLCGSILGQILFSLYVNNVLKCCPNVKVQLYADDTVLYVHAKTKQEAAPTLSAAMVPVSHTGSKIHIYILKG